MRLITQGVSGNLDEPLNTAVASLPAAQVHMGFLVLCLHGMD